MTLAALICLWKPLWTPNPSCFLFQAQTILFPLFTIPLPLFNRPLIRTSSHQKPPRPPEVPDVARATPEACYGAKVISEDPKVLDALLAATPQCLLPCSDPPTPAPEDCIVADVSSEASGTPIDPIQLKIMPLLPSDHPRTQRTRRLSLRGR